MQTINSTPEETTPDLFDHFETLPQAVQDILNNAAGADTYTALNELLAQLEPHGYIFDYYLDATPYNLRLITPA